MLPRPRRPIVRTALAAATVAMLLAACIPTPSDDYQDYLQKTETQRGGPIVDSGPPPDGSIPDGGASGNYLIWCLPRLALGDLVKSLRFRAELTFTGNAAGGKIDAKLYPLLKTATDLSQISTAGAALDIKGATVKADTSFSMVFDPSIVVAGDANPFSGNNITIEGARLDGYLLSTESFCAELVGEVTKPISSSFADPGDICLYRRFDQPSGPLPPLKVEDFHCP